MSHHHVGFFGMRYAVPAVSHRNGTVVAVNVGGAIIPTLMSIYLLIKRELWVGSGGGRHCRPGDSLAGRSCTRPRHRGAGLPARRSDRNSRHDTFTGRLGAACLHRW